MATFKQNETSSHILLSLWKRQTHSFWQAGEVTIVGDLPNLG